MIKKKIIVYLVVALLLICGIMSDYKYYEYKKNPDITYNFADEDDFIAEYAVNIPFRSQLLNMNGFLRCKLGLREMNGITKLNNGYLTDTSCPITEEDVINNINALLSFQKYCECNGVEFIYVQPPDKVAFNDSQLPAGVSDNHNNIANYVVKALRDKKIDVIDIREKYIEDGIDNYEMFYRTDHHWTTLAGFYAFSKIVEEVNSLMNVEPDYFYTDIDNYSLQEYPSIFLGTRGQRTGLAFAECKDNYVLIKPSFPTRILNETTGDVGSFEDNIIRYDALSEEVGDKGKTYDWVYKKGDINSLKSLDAPTDLNVLLLTDSFGYVVRPFMVLEYANFHVGSYSDLNKDYIIENDIDVVIVLPYTGVYSKDGFTFN